MLNHSFLLSSSVGKESVPDILLIVFSGIIIISYFFNLYSKKSGVPSVLLLIGLGMLVGLFLDFNNYRSVLDPLLKILGTVGLILIVLEAALDLKILKEKVLLILKSFFISVFGLGGTALTGALFLSFCVSPYIDFQSSLLITIPLSVLSSAIIIPSIDSLEERKREFLIYESTFSDIVGIIIFGFVIDWAGASSGSVDSWGISSLVFGKLMYTVVFSIIISYVLIYFFQKLKGHGKLFLLIAVLLFLYSLGHKLGLSSLIIILIFGVILNNYKLFFFGPLRDFILEEKIDSVLDDFKVVTIESSFVMRTFFFIIFGWSISFWDLLDIGVWLIGIPVLISIYLIRYFTLLLFNITYKSSKIIPELFLSPRGLITILLFYSIKNQFTEEYSVFGISFSFDGVLLLVILASCLIMSWALIKEKRRVEHQENEDFEILEEEEGFSLEDNDVES